MLVLKKKQPVVEDDEELRKEFAALERSQATASSSHDKNNTTLKDPRGEIQDGEKFLVDFFKNKKWKDHDDDHDDDDDDHDHDNDYSINKSKNVSNLLGNDDDHINNNIIIDEMDDEHELDKQDEFEASYNFRFEQAAPTSGADFSNQGYARDRGMAQQSLRRPDDARKQARQKRRDRKLAERKAKEEQLRRLKNAKQAEMKKKLTQIKQVLVGST
mmetsp:Transcript_51266/g.76594  ORF Transcript_51266/g.76594 Transcript_51266/m.76594 type:complete len:216 (+) Transcript_51266:502-1149(+)